MSNRTELCISLIDIISFWDYWISTASEANTSIKILRTVPQIRIELKANSSRSQQSYAEYLCYLTVCNRTANKLWYRRISCRPYEINGTQLQDGRTEDRPLHWSRRDGVLNQWSRRLQISTGDGSASIEGPQRHHGVVINFRMARSS